MVKKEQDLYITIPTFFRCPISLDLMKSPVSLCTGVTYDHASIQRWLDAGNNTCPATMQVLQNKELVPNRTLQRLIQIWSESDSVQPRPDSADSHKLELSSNRGDCLSEIVFVLQQGSLDSKIESMQILESMASDSESKLLIAEKEGLLSELVKLIGKENDPDCIEASLSCLISISMPKRVKSKLIQLRTIPKLRDILFLNLNCSVLSTEKSLKLLETLSSCKEGRMEICHDSLLIQSIVQKVLKVSIGATEHAVTVLWSVCYLFRDQKAVEAVAGGSSNGMTKFLLLMQSNCSAVVRQMAADLLKMFRVNSKSCLSSYDTRTTHIMPF